MLTNAQIQRNIDNTNAARPRYVQDLSTAEEQLAIADAALKQAMRAYAKAEALVEKRKEALAGVDESLARLERMRPENIEADIRAYRERMAQVNESRPEGPGALIPPTGGREEVQPTVSEDGTRATIVGANGQVHTILCRSGYEYPILLSRAPANATDEDYAAMQGPVAAGGGGIRR
jgi:hypothetical protein